MSATTVARKRVGVYSDVSEIAVGRAPPRPRPVTKRRAARLLMDVAKGVSKEHIANNATENISTGLRPKRSPASPSAMAPSMPPSRPAPKTGPNWEGSTCQLLAISGATNATHCVSKPSIMATSAQIEMIRYWEGPRRPEFTTVSKSTASLESMRTHCERFPRRRLPGLLLADRLLRYVSGFASIMQPTNKQGSFERLLQAWLVPRMMTVSPGRINTSSTSVTI